MIRRISMRLRALAAAAAALMLAACATAPSESGDAAGQQAQAPAASPAPQATAPAPRGATSYSDKQAVPPPDNDNSPTRTVTLPPTGRVSLAEYRAQMRQQLMQSENASADVADCAAHASWVVPRSATYDALRIPTGALASGQAAVESWEGRFSRGKQAVPVTSVVTFSAAAHRRNGQSGQSRWDPVKVRCGYDDGMMLAYELLDDDGDIIVEPAAKPAVSVAPARNATAKGRKAKATRSSRPGKATSAKSSASTKKAAAKSTSSSKSTKKTSKPSR
ncbi:BspC domain-containing protein [Cupriavidus gilardii]|uniref:BspC domain-containing protein n=1 Tax=Cupriavidus gilardii TaxID=82541 RepID=UPI003B2857FF